MFLPLTFGLGLLAAPQGDATNEFVARTPFVPNQGQWHEEARYLARRGAESYWLTDHGWIASVRADKEHDIAIRTTFEGAAPLRIDGEDPQPGTYNYMLGNDRDRWATGLTGVGAVRYGEMYSGIDASVSMSGGGFAYDFVIRPHGDERAIVMSFDGADRLAITRDGSLQAHTEFGFLAHSAPKAWEVDVDGERFPIAVRFRVLDDMRVGFDVADRTAGRGLYIDPGLSWSLIEGGGGIDRDSVQDLIAREDFVWSLIESRSASFPTTTGVFSTTNAGSQDCVVQFRAGPTGSLIYSTYIGGSGSEFPDSMAISSSFGVVLVGSSGSADYPTTAGVFQPANAGNGDGFITELDVLGTQIVWSTFLGGTDSELLEGLIEGPNGEWWLSGSTRSMDFPTAGALANTLTGGRDAFACRISADGSTLIDSLYIGGTDTDRAHTMSVSSITGGPVIGMVSQSTNFPVTPNAFQPIYGGGTFDFAVTFLDATWSSVIQSTFVGGSGTELLDGATDDGSCLCGSSSSVNFPVTPGAIQSTKNGSFFNAVLFCLDPNGGLTNSTYFGGPGGMSVRAMRANASGIAVAVNVFDSNVPVTAGAFQPTFGGGIFDSYVVRFDPALTRVEYASLIGGSLDDQSDAVALSDSGAIYVGGATNSTDFPLAAGAVAGFDAFVARFDGLPTGVSRYGDNSAPAALGFPTAFLGVNSMPTPGNSSFLATNWGAPASAVGAVVLSLAPDVAGTVVPGFDIVSHIDLTATASFTVVSDASGWGELPIDLSTTVAGNNFFMQTVWVDPATALLAASDAIDFTVQ